MANSLSIIWPEERTPRAGENFNICGLIEHESRMIWGKEIQQLQL
ncbi:hypothetical protein [Thalassobacillus pellis]|nr:hypothetical protein [Thalassobacillus pellis]MBM7551233.1 hypothetical protein [Thalassobacillus pellis]